MPRRRDYKLEYARRKAKGVARGLTLAQARGHPRAGEAGIKSARPNPNLEMALKALRRGASLKDAAAEARLSRERLSAYAKTQAGAARSGRAWTFNDVRRRRVQIIRGGQVVEIWVKGYEPARIAGQYMDEAGRMLADPSRIPAFQERWAYRAIRDDAGRLLTFPTDPNEIYRALHANDRPFEQIYKLVMVQ